MMRVNKRSRPFSILSAIGLFFTATWIGCSAQDLRNNLTLEGEARSRTLKYYAEGSAIENLLVFSPFPPEDNILQRRRQLRPLLKAATDALARLAATTPGTVAEVFPPAIPGRREYAQAMDFYCLALFRLDRLQAVDNVCPQTVREYHGVLPTVYDGTPPYTETVDLQCLALYQLRDYRRAAVACREAVAQAGSASGPIVATVDDAQEKQTAAEIDRLLHTAETGPTVALPDLTERISSLIAAYRQLPGADDASVRQWSGRLRPLSHRAAELQHEQHEAAIRKQEERHRSRYAAVLGMTSTQFEQWIEQGTTTVLGAPIFSNVEVDGSTLRLWFADSAAVFHNVPQYLQRVGQLGDAFHMWCGCDGVTTAGFDDRRMGGGSRVLWEFRYNPFTGQCEQVH